jgi:hypothetical protein
MIACQVELECIRCGKATGHTVVFTSGYIKRTFCHHCGFTLRQPVPVLVWCYCHDLPRRSFVLTQRLRDEARQHPRSFVLSLPRRLIDKPLEVSREFADLCFA